MIDKIIEKYMSANTLNKYIEWKIKAKQEYKRLNPQERIKFMEKAYLRISLIHLAEVVGK